jgi:hypothetical protein
MRRLCSLLVLIWLASLSGCSLSSYGIFRNETANVVHITIISQAGEKYGALTVAPHSSAKTNIGNGTAVVTTSSGKPLAHCDLMPPQLVRQYYDLDNRTFYHRVTNGKIALVLPVYGRKWNG